MATLNRHIMSRRGFCLCCMAATTVAATDGWLSPRQAFAEAIQMMFKKSQRRNLDLSARVPRACSAFETCPS